MTTKSLTVAEASLKDSGKSLARLNNADMELLGVSSGDIIKIAGEAETVAKVMPSHTDSGTIQIDGITRQNAQVSLGESVKVKKVRPKEATNLTLTPIGPSQLTQRDAKTIAHYLADRPLSTGDRVRINLPGGSHQDFEVVDTQPEGAMIIKDTTRLKLKGAGQKVDRQFVTYEDIGGLDEEIGKIREMIELPLRFPQVFEKLGIGAPKGVLLHGPPGCGKTLIARAVANESQCTFLRISGPEIMHKYYGESESHLRAIFEEAQKSAPAIIFIDEIEAIAPKRENLGGEKQVEIRVVATLLALMDGLEGRGQVIVIGATNVPDILDPALRRPGRFDREIIIGVPNREGREEILEIHSRGMPLAPEVDLVNLAEITHGFTGADLEALCREAAMSALRTLLPDVDFENAIIPHEKLAALEVTMEHFAEAKRGIEPSAIREVYIEIPNVTWDDVGGLKEVKRILQEAVEWPLRYPRLIKHMATPPPRGILLYGPPGTGKTLVAKAVAHEAGVNFIAIKGPSLMSKYVGESEKGVREVFKKGRQSAPCIIFFDEIDAIAPRRAGGDATHVSERTLSQLLNEMDGIEALDGVVVLAATNRLDLLDEAILRAGRFDFQLELPLPDEEARLKIFEIHARGKPLAKNVDLEKLASETEGYTGADVAALCQKAAFLAMREFIEKTGEENAEKKAQECEITRRHFLKAQEALAESIASL